MSSASRPLFRSTAQPGYSHEVSSNPRHVTAHKLPSEVTVTFALNACTVKSREGLVHAHPGDAIVIDGAGERWRISRAHFSEKYRAVAPTIAGQDGRYISLPTRVMAVQVPEPFDVILVDGVSRLSGQPNDWLVDYGDGSLGIVAADIFAATYAIVPSRPP